MVWGKKSSHTAASPKPAPVPKTAGEKHGLEKAPHETKIKHHRSAHVSKLKKFR